jgi:hypothetical protein
MHSAQPHYQAVNVADAEHRRQGQFLEPPSQFRLGWQVP